jgi:hypothetical protein
MRAYFSLLAVALLVSQSAAGSNLIAESSREQDDFDVGIKTAELMVELADEDNVPFGIELVLLGAEDKSAEVCNGRKVSELVTLTEMPLESCSKEALREHSNICASLKSDSGDKVCKNVREYCRKFLTIAAYNCIDQEEEVLEIDASKSDFLRDLEAAVSSDDYLEFMDSDSHLEKFLAKD